MMSTHKAACLAAGALTKEELRKNLHSLEVARPGAEMGMQKVHEIIENHGKSVLAMACKISP